MDELSLRVETLGQAESADLRERKSAALRKAHGVRADAELSHPGSAARADTKVRGVRDERTGADSGRKSSSRRSRGGNGFHRSWREVLES
jgi:hypothetical protein